MDVGYFMDLVSSHAKNWSGQLSRIKVNIGYYRSHVREIIRKYDLPKDSFREDFELMDRLGHRLTNFSDTELRLFESVSDMQIRGFFIGYEHIKKHAGELPACLDAWFSEFDALLNQRTSGSNSEPYDKEIIMLMQAVGAEMLTAWNKALEEITAYLKIMEEKYQDWGDHYHELMDSLSAWDDEDWEKQ